MSTPETKFQCEVCETDLLQVGERRVSCPGDDLSLSLCPVCAAEVLAQLIARGISLRCTACAADLLQVGEWRAVSCPEETLDLFFCSGCAGEVLTQLAARGITPRASDLELGVYEFK